MLYRQHQYRTVRQRPMWMRDHFTGDTRGTACPHDQAKLRRRRFQQHGTTERHQRVQRVVLRRRTGVRPDVPQMNRAARDARLIFQRAEQRLVSVRVVRPQHVRGIAGLRKSIARRDSNHRHAALSQTSPHRLVERVTATEDEPRASEFCESAAGQWRA